MRNLSPSINFSFEEIEIYGKRVVGLVIPAATEISTAFKEKRFLRIELSKCNMKDYPKREIELLKILDGRMETIESVPAKYQELTFQKFFGYYGSKGSNLFSIHEFGNDHLLYSLDELLRYGDVLNLIQTDETDRVVERNTCPGADHGGIFLRRINPCK